MKLEELLGAELYAQVQAKLDEVNGKETDKQKRVRYNILFFTIFYYIKNLESENKKRQNL